ncbi:hypothetical protein BD410DRAFT_265758 [Rickenella mellea]|uniref:Mid2 domain-containing protein n=1 Tax=Rickenella mellea TaxID=50990 RepID=A0A4Y7Q368_9AGAM|nr:hypothetical protein BD410DRAFT_265758 [Rickenella mellea]
MAFYHQRLSIPLFLFIFAFLLLSALARPAHAANSSSNIAFARKSFQGRRHHRHAGRRDIVDTAGAVVDSVTNGVEAVVDGGGSSNSSSSSSSSLSSTTTTTTTTSSSTTSSSDSSTSTSSSTSKTTSDTSSTTSTTSSDSKTTPSNTASDSSTPSPTSSGSSSDSSTSASTTASATDSTPSSDSSSSTGSSSGTNPTDSSSNTASDSSSQSSSSSPGTTSVGDPTSTNPSPTDSSSDSGSSSPTDSSSNPPPTDSSSNSPQPTTTPPPPDTTSSSPTDSPTQSASDSSSSSSSCGLLDVILGTCSTSTSSSSDAGPTVSQPSPTDSGTSSDSPPTQTDSGTTSDAGPTISIPPISIPPITTTSSAPPDTTSSSDTGGTASDSVSNPPPITTASVSGTTSDSVPNPPITISGSGSTSDSVSDTQTASLSITFPTGTGTTSSVFGSPTESFTSLSTLSALPDTSATSTFSMPPLQSQFSFLTQSTLIVAPTTTSGSDSLTITNPDQATTTASLVGVSQTLAATQAALPSGLPARFLPAEGVTANDDLSGYSPVSIMFDSGLNWAFVAANPDSVAGEIFAYLCVVLEAALSISQDGCKNYALQVYEPSTYQGPQDVSQLRTTWIGFIPSDTVNTLAAQIIAKQSPVYTGTTGIPNELAQHIDPSYGVKAVTDPFSSSDGGHNSNTTSSASSSADNVRRDAIIGVCAALGGIAVCILIWLVARNIKRRRESQHRRLSDPDIGTRVPGTQFDQDSVGGQRRRSFYYAEDSLRGYAAQQGGDEVYDHRISPQGGMRERRPVATGAISAPILRDNTLNW